MADYYRRQHQAQHYIKLCLKNADKEGIHIPTLGLQVSDRFLLGVGFARKYLDQLGECGQVVVKGDTVFQLPSMEVSQVVLK